MPGISLYYNFSRDGLPLENNFSHALKDLKHDNRYKTEILFHKSYFLVGSTKYYEYPIKKI